jgi:hypothetical protein
MNAPRGWRLLRLAQGKDMIGGGFVTLAGFTCFYLSSWRKPG